MARDSEQPSLFGFEAAPRDKHLILMIYPDQQARTAAQARGRRYQADNGLGGAIFNPDLMHVTLGHFDYWDEVPASLIERISDPLNHLVRNAVDHGIETPEVRAASGKPAKGTVRLSAGHRGGSVVIEIADDDGRRSIGTRTRHARSPGWLPTTAMKTSSSVGSIG